MNQDHPKLSTWAKKVLYENGTEPPYQNEYWNHWAPGLYVHVVSLKPLFSSYDKFSSSCGWPTFYQPLNRQDVVFQPDHSHNMIRTELRDHETNTHLGHVFEDLDPENLKQNYLRYCLNSASLKFVSETEILNSDNEAWKAAWAKIAHHKNDLTILVIAGGCFWGVQHLIRDINGVYDTKTGYANYDPEYSVKPTYYQVCSGQTKAAEAVQVIFNRKVLPISKLLTIVFKYVDPTTLNYQANDVGTQYRSGIYYIDSLDQAPIIEFINDLKSKYQKPIVVEVLPLQNFALAEEEHQDYLIKNPNGYCHIKF